MRALRFSNEWRPGLSLALLVVALGGGCTSRAEEASQHGDAPVAPERSDKMSEDRKPSQAELKAKLSPLQYKVTQQEGTEAPFNNEYWDNKKDGIYVDVVSGEPLFSSQDKFDSGTGWPSFTKPIDTSNVETRTDRSAFLGARTEVRSRKGDSHLGHVFDDGPAPTGKRFCLNSAAMRFVPVDRLAAEGYGEFLALFGRPAAAGTTGKAPAPARRETATFAGGCFWGMEELVRQIPGVLETVVGYTGGTLPNATYADMKTGTTGHAEAVEVTFDPSKLSYEQLLGAFFRMHDPTTLNRQGNDVGTAYRSTIFVHSDEQRRIAERVKAEVDRSGKWKKPVVTTIVPATAFYKAEDYHQDYLQKNPGGYTCHFIRD